jgi:hypothetical protein
VYGPKISGRSRLEEVVPDDHLLHAIAAVLDLSWIYAELATYYPEIGRPSWWGDTPQRLRTWGINSL